MRSVVLCLMLRYLCIYLLIDFGPGAVLSLCSAMDFGKLVQKKLQENDKCLCISFCKIYFVSDYWFRINFRRMLFNFLI